MADDDPSRLTDDEKAALVALLRRTIDADRFPLSPRIRLLRGILEKLEGSRPVQPPPPPSPSFALPRATVRQRRTRGKRHV
jgi:hypothetical protein